MKIPRLFLSLPDKAKVLHAHDLIADGFRRRGDEDSQLEKQNENWLVSFDDGWKDGMMTVHIELLRPGFLTEPAYKRIMELFGDPPTRKRNKLCKLLVWLGMLRAEKIQPQKR